jgi:hypothetical protein
LHIATSRQPVTPGYHPPSLNTRQPELAEGVHFVRV